MKLTRTATLAIAATALITAVALVPTLAAQAPDARLPGPRQFMPIGAHGSTAWVIDVHAQKIIACGLEGDPKNPQVSCRTGAIP